MLENRNRGFIEQITMLTSVATSFNVNVSILLILAVTISFYKWRFQFWKSRNVPHQPPSIPLGNINLSHMNMAMHEVLKSFYDTMKEKGHKHCGFFTLFNPCYLPIEPEYVKAVLTKDFHHFHDRGLYYNEKGDPLSCTLLPLEGERWKKLRAKFTPAFSPGKIKIMFENMLNCANGMVDAIDKSSQKIVNIKEIAACFTTDVIGSCVFGIDCGSFDENAAALRALGRKVYNITLWFLLKIIFSSCLPTIAKILNVTLIGKESTIFFRHVISTTMKYREENNVVRKDFLQLLMELRQNHEEGLSLDEACAQSFLFFAAGFETSSTTISFAIHELSQRQDIQEKVRKEIRDVLDKNDGAFTYENVTEMKYLNQIIDETLRKHPSVPTIPRICTKTYKLPDGKGEIEEGTHVFVPVLALHRDPEYYPDPDKFDPDRFNDESKAKRHPYAYLPFGEGPRNCLGQKFGLLQVKIGLANLLNNFSFKLHHSTEKHLRYNKNSMFLSSRDPIWIVVEKLNI